VKSKKTYRYLLFILILAVCLIHNIFPQSKTDKLSEKHFITAVSHNNIPIEFENDLKATILIWMHDRLKEFDDYTFDVMLFKDSRELKKILSENKNVLIIFSSNEFLSYRKKIDLEGGMLIGTAKDELNSFALIVRENLGINKVEDLFNKRIIIPGRMNGEVAKIWFENLILKETNADLDTEMKKVVETQNDSNPVLKVFFGSAEACIVGKSYYETMCELNPQLKKNTKIFKTSTRLITGIIATHKFENRELLDSLYHKANNLNNDIYGAQLFALFKINSLLLYNEEYLQPLRTLIEENNRLKNTANRVPK
jgi:hypothetical protein